MPTTKITVALNNSEWTIVKDSTYGIFVSDASGLSSSAHVYLLVTETGTSAGTVGNIGIESAISLMASDLPKRIDFEGIYPVEIWGRTDSSDISLSIYSMWNDLAKPVDASRTTLEDEEKEIFNISSSGLAIPRDEWKDFRSNQIYSYVTTEDERLGTRPYPLVYLLRRVLQGGKKAYNNIVSGYTRQTDSSQIVYTVKRQGIEDGISNALVDLDEEGTDKNEGTSAAVYSFTVPASSDGSRAGLLSTVAQTIAGAKTFTSPLTVKNSTLSIRDSNNNGLSLANTGAIVSTGRDLSMTVPGNRTVSVNDGTGTVKILGTYSGTTTGASSSDGRRESTFPVGVTAPNLYVGSESSRTNIQELYGARLRRTTGTTLGEKIALLDNSSTTDSNRKILGSEITLSSATATQSGVVTTGSQVFAGEKTLTSTLFFKKKTTDTKALQFFKNYGENTLELLDSNGNNTATLVVSRVEGNATSANKVNHALTLSSSTAVGNKTYDGSSAISVYTPNQNVNSGSNVTFGTVTASLTGTASNASKLNNKADSAFVHLAGAETLTGKKTLTGGLKATGGVEVDSLTATGAVSFTNTADNAFTLAGGLSTSSLKVGTTLNLGNGVMMASSTADDTLKITSGTAIVTIRKADPTITVKNGSYSTVIGKNSVYSTNGSYTSTLGYNNVVVKYGSKTATVASDSVKVTDGTNTATLTSIGLEVT